MLFNSYTFVFGYLPVVLLGFYALGARRREWALLWLTAASLLFLADGLPDGWVPSVQPPEPVPPATPPPAVN